jgi:uncharacterized protein YprB with RNaseH-like and TPR domain
MQESIGHHAAGNLSYFAENLLTSQHWRLYGDFQDACAFLDIETTGLSLFADITTIALYDGRTIRYYVNGDNLDDFPEHVKDYRLLVTYSGKLFDFPRIEGYFGIRLPQAHIDLRYPLGSVGLKGGLKSCERQLGIERQEVESIDGSVAVLLWQEYRKYGNAKALESLLAYNIRDAVNLKPLMVHAYNQKVKATPFAESRSLPMPALPKLPFEADKETVQRVVRQRTFSAFSWSR